jgi:hypothetical protein
MKEHRMSKTWEHYHHAARHHEQAAYHFEEAAKYDEAEEREKAAHHAYLAHGHNQLAIHHDSEAAKLRAEKCDSSATPVGEQGAKKKSAAREWLIFVSTPRLTPKEIHPRRSVPDIGNVPRSAPPVDGEKDRLMNSKPEGDQGYDGICWTD